MDLGRKLLRFCTAGENLPSEDLVSPRSSLTDRQVEGRGCKDVMSCDEGILPMSVNGEPLEEDVECELDEAPQEHWAGSDEVKLHRFVMDYCFPSQGITV